MTETTQPSASVFLNGTGVHAVNELETEDNAELMSDILCDLNELYGKLYKLNCLIEKEIEKYTS
ncbi:MAG: hypothetical protein LBU82_00160 [Treponema sp.]|jgi:hypothetical protein|nr:hypothetical protein [Treponema sp.]